MTSLEEIAQRHQAATKGQWQWVDPDTDEPCSPDLPCEAGGHSKHAYRFSLRTVEEFPTASVGPLPKFVIHTAEEFYEVEVPGEPMAWRHPDADFIANAPTDIGYLLEIAQAARALLVSYDDAASGPDDSELDDAFIALRAALDVHTTEGET